jgi:hypothetical protein
MFENLKTFWNKPYPPMDNMKENFIISIGFGFFVFFFLLLFFPFSDELNSMSLKVLSGYGIVTTLVTLFTFAFVKYFVTGLINVDNWKVKHAFYFSIWNLLIIAVANYLYMIYVEGKTTDVELWETMYSTITIGTFPVLFILYFSEKRLLKQKIDLAKRTTDVISKNTKSKSDNSFDKKLIYFEAIVPADNFSMESHKLLFIKADGNYSRFYYKNGEDIENKISRVLLKSVENQLKEHPEFQRCHRSYLVNINNVEEVVGNARNVSLCFENSKFLVPVSRSKEKEIIEIINRID